MNNRLMNRKIQDKELKNLNESGETGGEVPPLREQEKPNTHNIKVAKIK